MIITVSVARFVWNPMLWLFVTVISAVLVAFLCNLFDDDPETELETADTVDSNEIADEEVAIFARTYIKIWMKNRYKYLLLPFVFFAVCLIILLVG